VSNSAHSGEAEFTLTLTLKLKCAGSTLVGSCTKLLLLKQKSELDQQSAALAFKYAREAEKAKQKQNAFWGDIKQLTGW
jgi:hypothetical protein